MTDLPTSITMHRGVHLAAVRLDELDRPELIYVCDCATITVLTLSVEPGATGTHEIAFTCDGCSSAHWVTFTINDGVEP